MFEKLSRSWTLVKASAAVLRSDKQLLLFPAMSALSTLVVAASFFVPVLLSGAFEHTQRDQIGLGTWLFMFLFYFVQYSVIIFFNSALVGAALIRLRGGTPTLADGFHIALSKLPAILGYAAISATVGVLLRALQERAGFIGRWVIGLLGVAWTIATFLAVPVLVANDVGPIDAVKRSAALLKRTWGENLAGNVGIGLVFGVLFFALLFGGGALVVLAVAAKSPVLAVALGVVLVVAFALLALIQAALQGIYAAAVYRYAEEGGGADGFDAALVADAFKVKA